MHWAKTRPAAKYDLAGSNVLACSIDDLQGAAGALSLEGRNDNGYQPLVDAIAAQYGVPSDHVTTAQGTSGANFLAFAALLSPGDDVLIERPGYDPLIGAVRLLGANVVRFDRVFDDGYRLDPERVAAALTPRTKLIVVTSLHNPSGAIASGEALEAIGRLAASRGAVVLVDEVYLDATPSEVIPAARRGDVFISTSSLTKSYGLAGLRCGWILSSPAIAERIRRARDVVDGTGSIVAERLAVLAFSQLDRLHARAVSLLAANRATVEAFLGTRDELEWVPPAGGTVMFPRIRGLDDVSPFAERLLRERDTAIVPGRFFDAPAHFRLGFAIEGQRLAHGLQILGQALDGLRGDG
jgi:aspartate/methionine/tyrosine aminotransferase